MALTTLSDSVVPAPAAVIAIDGPGGAGKGTAAQRVATTLGWHILDSGLIYRLLGLAWLRGGGASITDGSAVEREIAEYSEPLAALALAMPASFAPNPQGDGLLALLDGEDVSAALRSEEAGMMASQVAALPAVREALLQRQRAFAEPPGLVADGRDMGTVVFADAPLKIFLTASVEARAQRRYEQLLSAGLSGNLARLQEAIAARDHADMNRAVAPLRPADDAVLIDSTALSIDAVCAQILALAAERGLS